MEAVNVVCVKYGTKYGADYVIRLRNMVARHLPRGHTFTCLTEASVEGISCGALPCDLPGWWAKVGLFKPGVSTGPTFYLDLDVVITAEMKLPELDEKVWALDDFSYSLLTPKPNVDVYTRRLLGGSGTVNSSVMYWRGDVGRKVWDDFKPDIMNELHGDQNWITRCLWPDKISLFPPGLACSFKYHVDRGVKPAPITVFHGSPKPSDLSSRHPLRVLWEAA